MTDVIESEEYNGGRIEIVIDQDGYASNPREWCNLSALVFAPHHNYTMPNEVDFPFSQYDDDADDGGGRSGETFAEWCVRTLEEEYGALYVAPVSMTDHSGTTYYVGAPRDPWDSGQVGYAIVTPETVAECGTPPELFAEGVAAEIATYGAWANGEVYGWVALDDDGETIESCWGYVGDDNFPHMISEARAEIDAWADERDETANAIAADAMRELVHG